MATYINVRPIVVNESAGFADVVVTLSAASAQTVSLNYSWTSSSASFADFDLSSGSLSFAPGELSKTLRVTVVNDTASEPHESFLVTFNTPVNAVLSQSQVVVTIAANDGSPGTPNISVSDATVDEKSGTASVVVTLDKPATEQVSVSYSTVDGNASAGLDYQSIAGTLVFAVGQIGRAHV